MEHDREVQMKKWGQRSDMKEELDRSISLKHIRQNIKNTMFADKPTDSKLINNLANMYKDVNDKKMSNSFSLRSTWYATKVTVQEL